MKHERLLYFMTVYCILLIGLVGYRIYLDNTTKKIAKNIKNEEKISFESNHREELSITEDNSVKNYIDEFIASKDNEIKELLKLNPYKSEIDKDNDGIDDQTDILNNAKRYIATNPQYKSIYYDTGYSTDQYGVCTDVIAFALRDAGYDIMTLVHEDIKKNNNKQYKLRVIDKNIDFRRVGNLKIYFDNHAKSLTKDIEEKREWQGGDIIVYQKHIGLVSDKRNEEGYPYIIHLARKGQEIYEEDIMVKNAAYIVGHYRIS